MKHVRQWLSTSPHGKDLCNARGSWCTECGCCEHCLHECTCVACGCSTVPAVKPVSLTTAEDWT